MLALYDGEVAYVDDQIERLLAGLPGDAPLLVVTSDHGETHGEHGSWFSRDLHQACLHVPLLVHFPDGRHRGLRVEQQVRLIDIAPTLLDYLGVEAEPTSGISLRELLEDASSPAERPAYALAVFPPSSQREESAFSLRHLGFKLIWRSSRVAAGALVPASELFYDAALDPLETEPLREDQAAGERSALRDQLESWRTQSLPQGEKLEESTTEGLENLGYTGRD
jgi:arylsulfatase A-like enzyme